MHQNLVKRAVSVQWRCAVGHHQCRKRFVLTCSRDQGRLKYRHMAQKRNWKHSSFITLWVPLAVQECLKSGKIRFLELSMGTGMVRKELKGYCCGECAVIYSSFSSSWALFCVNSGVVIEVDIGWHISRVAKSCPCLIQRAVYYHLSIGLKSSVHKPFLDNNAPSHCRRRCDHLQGRV